MKEKEKLAVLVSCTDHYRERMYLFAEYLQAKGYRLQYLAADFHHTNKARFTCAVAGAVQLPVRPYRKNLSASRILSHLDFARGVCRYLEQLPQEPDMVVAEIPPNFLANYLGRYKRKHPNVKLVLDIFDLWPETFPSGKAKKLLALPFAIWGSLRNRALPYADIITTECDLFRQKLKLTADARSHTIYLAGPRRENIVCAPRLPQTHLSLCYLGSINNIIDIPAIATLVGQLSARKPVTVHIIGKGERTEEFISALKNAGGEVIDHGPVYDEEKKQEIIDVCHFGLNIMKSSVCIGLTMKSVDYWSHGLPVISSIPADTARLIDAWQAGINLGPDTAQTVADLTPEALLALRENVYKLYAACFTPQVVMKALDDAIQLP